MSIISRLTTWSVGQILKAADLNNEFSNITNVLNNVDGGTTTWSNCNSTTSTITTLTPTTLTHGSMKYRRPVLQYSSGTVVNLETGIDGTSGEAQILFPDGSLRRDSTTTRINCNLAQNAVLSGTAQSGLRTGSQSANLWYSFYAVKVTDSSTNFVTVADTVLPIQANFATLNTNFGTNGWVYLGCLANGDNASSTNVILKFIQSGSYFTFRNVCVGNANNCVGVRLATQSVAGASLTWTYAAGTNIATPQTPNQFTSGLIIAAGNNTAQETAQLLDAASTIRYMAISSPSGGSNSVWSSFMPLVDGAQMTGSASNKHDIFMASYFDGVLGVGSNPIL
jgi:hypothetical protein